MTLFKKISTSLIISFMFAIMAVSFNNCSGNLSPVSPDQEVKVKEQKGIKFLSFGKAPNSLKKIVSVSRYIKRHRGGLLYLDYAFENADNEEVEVEIGLKIQRYSIEESNRFTMGIDDEYFLADLDVTFGPHGTQFSIPALLNISIDGIDLTGVDPNATHLYYDNQDTGEWELMECDSIIINIEEGELDVINGKLPHFSRYAIGQDTTGT